MATRTVEDLLNGYGSGLEFESFILPILRDSGYFEDFRIRRFDWDFGLDATARKPSENDNDVRLFIDVKYSQHDRRVTLDPQHPSVSDERLLTVGIGV
jgi:hypothetical protein